MLQVSLLLLSFAGYFLLLYILFQGRRTALYPAVLASGIMVISFIGGLVDCLGSVYGFLYVAGYMLMPVCVMYLIRHRKEFRLPRMRELLPLLVFVVGAYILYHVFEDRFIYATDDVAHWARAVRSISDHLRLPLETDEFSHGSYPPGSALYIAFVSAAMGASDQVWYFAHTLLLLSFWISLLDAGRNWLVQAALACFIPLFMNYVNPLESLYVDTMLSASAMAGLTLCLQEEKSSARGILLMALLLCPLALIKNSGMFIALLIAGYQIVRYWGKHRAFSWHLLALTVPFVLLAAWNLYFSQHFVRMQQHEMSVSYYSRILGEKSAQDVISTIRMVVSHMLNPHENHVLTVIPGYLLLMLVLARQGKLRVMRHMFIFAAVLAVAYEAGVLLMYVFSMPEVEIIINEGSDFMRYNSTVSIALQALLLYLCASLEWPGLKRFPLRSIGIGAAVLACCAGVLWMQADQHRPFHPRQYRVDNYPAAYQASLMQDELRSLSWDDSYVVCTDIPERWEGYNRMLLKYYLGSAEVTRCASREEALDLRAKEPWKYYIDLGEGVIEAPVETVNTELFTRTDRSLFTNLLDTAGYKENTRYSTTAGMDTVTYYWDTTGYIPIKAGDVIRLKNVTWQATTENEARGSICWYDAEKKLLSSLRTKTADRLTGWRPVYDEKGNIIQITVPASVGSKAAYLRICCQHIGRDSIITVNERIP